MKQLTINLFLMATTLSFVAFENHTVESKQNCTWFVYDTPVIPESSDWPITATMAKNQNNYRAINPDELIYLCPGNLHLCAICSQRDINNPTKPLILGQPIAVEIDNYFSQPINSRFFTSSFLGREKNFQ